jgi:hypothetical protein
MLAKLDQSRLYLASLLKKLPGPNESSTFLDEEALLFSPIDEHQNERSWSPGQLPQNAYFI